MLRLTYFYYYTNCLLRVWMVTSSCHEHSGTQTYHIYNYVFIIDLVLWRQYIVIVLQSQTML
jgi:hypothetical protein